MHRFLTYTHFPRFPRSLVPPSSSSYKSGLCLNSIPTFFDFKRQSGLITDRVCSIWSNSWRFLAGPFFSSSLFVSCRQRLSPSIIFTKRMSNFFISFPPQICILLIGKISQFGLKVLFFYFRFSTIIVPHLVVVLMCGNGSDIWSCFVAI